MRVRLDLPRGARRNDPSLRQGAEWTLFMPGVPREGDNVHLGRGLGSFAVRSVTWQVLEIDGYDVRVMLG